jgi:DNA-binding NarL/FixJ family response regulator
MPLPSVPDPVIGVFACESQPVVLEGLRRIFSGTPDLALVGSSADPLQALEAIELSEPQVVLVDQTGGLRGAFRLLSELKARAPQAAPVLWVQDLAEIESFRALQLGARGILRRTLPVESLLACLRAASQGSVWMENSISNQVAGFLNRRSMARLTPREREIIEQIMCGAKNKDVALALGITPGTVKVHLMHIFEKTGVKDRLELAMQGPRLLGLSSAELVTGTLGLPEAESLMVTA